MIDPVVNNLLLVCLALITGIVIFTFIGLQRKIKR